MEQAIKIGMIAVSVAVIIISAVFCLAKIVVSSHNAMARQPEIADKAKDSMVMPLTLIEGTVLMGVGLCGYLAS